MAPDAGAPGATAPQADSHGAMAPAAVAKIEHDASGRRFSTEVNGLRAHLDYRLDGRIMTITHTEVPPPIAGRGIAARLMKEALATAQASGATVVPACSYAAAYMRRTEEISSQDPPP